MPNIPGGWELIVVVVLIMVLFGYKRLPEATRSLGKSMRIFKAETKGLKEDGTTTTTTHLDPAPVRTEVTHIQPVVQPVAQPEQPEQRRA